MPVQGPNHILLLFRPSRPDFIETVIFTGLFEPTIKLFRPSRPDFIETRHSL